MTAPEPATSVSAAPRLRVLCCGVGGQGVLSAARWLGDAAMLDDQQVRVGQLHGMSQRGGSVQATVLIGPGHGSFIGRGQADVVLALEPLELGRAASCLAPGGHALVNLGRVVPFHLAMKGLPYPDLDTLFAPVVERGAALHRIAAQALAAQAGSPRAANVVMLGALGALGVLPFGAERLVGAMARRSPAALLEANRRAFALGGEAVCG